MFKSRLEKQGKVIINTFNDNEMLGSLNIYKFTTYLDAINKMLIALLVDTEAKNNETCTLLKEDIRDKVILLRGKGNRQRQVAISPLLKKYMIRYEIIREFYFKDKRIKVNNYFLSNTGKSLTPETVVREAGKRANVRDEIRCSPYTIAEFIAIG